MNCAIPNFYLEFTRVFGEEICAILQFKRGDRNFGAIRMCQAKLQGSDFGFEGFERRLIVLIVRQARSAKLARVPLEQVLKLPVTLRRHKGTRPEPLPFGRVFPLEFRTSQQGRSGEEQERTAGPVISDVASTFQVSHRNYIALRAY